MIEKIVIDSLGRTMIGLYTDTGKWIKWMPQNSANPELFVVGIGKYKQHTLGYIYEHDPDYVHWLANKSCYPRVKRRANEFLDRLTTKV